MVEEESVKESRIRNILMSYYYRQDVRKAIVDFAKNRECVPRYFEGFGKRPDTLNYELDILELVKKGATSFHCSEELWSDPLELSTTMSHEQLDSLRIGWDLLIDIDSKYFDYSKIYAEILIKILRQEGIKNIGIKFSGSKGFHLIIPWKAFPKELSGKKTKDMFPEWPRLICKYLGGRVREELKNRILDLGTKNKEEKIEVFCQKCGAIAEKKKVFHILCPPCRTQIQISFDLFKKKRKLQCSNCFNDLSFIKDEGYEIEKIKSEEFYFCKSCNINSKNNSENFKERIKSEDIDADIVLVSPRHLFRMPYSLHEKTSFSSVVLDPDKIKEFDIKDAHPMKIVKIKNFLPDCGEGEASELLRQAIENAPREQEQKISFYQEEKPKKTAYKEIVIKDLTPDMYPPAIKQILDGMKSDGRKRALFVLLNFFRSLRLDEEKIKKLIEEWNQKNYEPLKSGYVQSQLIWHFRTQPKLPPNYNKPYYKEIGISPTFEEIKSKNPVTYVARIKFIKDRREERKQEKRN